MAIEGYTEYEFGEKLGTVLSASRPIHSIEHLKGRDQELDTIRKSLYAHGRHVFIHGDRGVGKSSLGQTAAYMYQSSDAEPIFASGSPDDTFSSVIANIASQAINRSRTESTKKTSSMSIEWRGLKWSEGSEHSSLDLSAYIRTIGDAVELLKQIAQQHSEKPVIVLDEFDTIRDTNERNKFSALLKQLGDQSVNIKFIFTGIGKSLDELLGSHLSSYRQLETVELPRLGWDARREIVKSAVNALDIGIDDNVNWRIAMISDGFPYYIHLIMEKILWAAFSEKEVITEIDSNLFMYGLRDAIFSTSAELKKPYEKAVIHHPELEDLVWATADHDDLIRSLSDMYQSYIVISGKRQNTSKTIDRSKFSENIRKLKGEKYGSVLRQEEGRSGFYSYREKMLRGYVRMQAEVNGIELTGEQSKPKQRMHIGNARNGYHGEGIPHGVRSSQKISEWKKR